MEVSPDAAPAVGFKVFTDAQTRGLITDNTAGTTGIQTTGFGVFAYYTGQTAWSNTGSFTPNFMYNQKVTYANSAWAYTPMKYWPNTVGDKISFFAYAPYKTASNGIAFTTTTATATGAPQLNFTLADTPTGMVDLVATNAGQTSPNKTIDLEKSTAKVPFKFKHVLTRASFKAKLDASLANTNQTHVFITGMRILGTNARTDASNAGNNVTANPDSKFFNAATYKWADGTWDYTAPTKQGDPYPLESILDRKTPSSAASYNKSSIELPQGATEIALFQTNHYLFLIPPTDAIKIDTGGGITLPTDVRVQIDYDIVTVDASLDKGYSITSTTATVSLPNGTLKRGSAYLYTFTVGLEKVQVTAEVENWAQDNNVYVPSASATNVAGIVSAIAVLNTTKGNNKNCNYFVINCSGSSYGTVNLGAATVTNFVSGDKIELNFAASPGVTSVTTPTGWKADKANLSAIGKIILTKN